MSAPNGQTISICGNIFRLVETIGRGSYGTVHKGLNVGSSAEVAIKVISKEKLQKPHERNSIEKEIETMRVAVEQYENGHPHIVRLLCTKESQHHIFIVLEYCAGGDISTYIKLNGGLPEQKARVFMSHLAAGLQFLRFQNVIHRDLKPANLLLSSKDKATAKLKIADFGFARELQSESMAESVVGSPLYMAPELLEYKSYDAKADLWSVGIILYEMIVNDHPFLVVNNRHATNHLALRRNIQLYYEKYGRLRMPPNVSVSEDCASLIEQLLRPNPQERISFEDFFTAKFLLPPPPNTNEDALVNETSSGNDKPALLVGGASRLDSVDWVDVSAEYVIVEKEYEDVGREVLDEKDLSSDFDSSPSTVMSEGIEEKEETKDAPVVRALPTIPATCAIPIPAPATSITEKKGTKAVLNPLDPWQQDQIDVEELLGICYKSFSTGNVALFVPTPRGDYIAFHEGCPHYYLSEESVQAAQRDTRKPPYVLGCIVMIDTLKTTAGENPYHLKVGTTFHIVMVSALTNQELFPEDSDASDTTVQSVASSFKTVISPIRTSPHLSGPPRRHANHQRISFRSFQIQDLALFFQKSSKQHYVAFNEGCPHYYLADESIQVAKGTGENNPAYICGEIIMIDSFQATEDFNPYRLSYSTRFYVVTVQQKT